MGGVTALSSDGTSTTNTGGALTWSKVDDSIDTNFEMVLTTQKVDDL